MFQTNKLYRHIRTLGDVDHLCIRVIHSHLDQVVVMRPVHRRFGPYNVEYITMSQITSEEMQKNWVEVVVGEQ